MFSTISFEMKSDSVIPLSAPSSLYVRYSSTRFETPRSLITPVSPFSTIEPIVVIIITELMPMMIPSIVRNARILFALSPARARSTFSLKFIHQHRPFRHFQPFAAFFRQQPCGAFHALRQALLPFHDCQCRLLCVRRKW